VSVTDIPRVRSATDDAQPYRFLPDFVAEALAPLCQGKGRDELLWKDAKGDPLRPAAKPRNSPTHDRRSRSLHARIGRPCVPRYFYRSG
jgi:hypothetical protein